jgi:2-polyprenyl-3-methyl-5-hydroxy-6-metoxy-1,4-benzoquinol methylase
MTQAYNSFPCDVCGTDSPVSIDVAQLYTNNQKLYACGNCGFVYVKDRRSAEEIAKSWSHDIFQKGYTAKIPYVLARQTYVADFIDVNIGLDRKKICDIGAGEGQFLDICKAKTRNNLEVYGIEPSAHNISLLKEQGFDAFQGTIEQFAESVQFKNNKFDLVTIMWTLENCLDCNGMIKAAWEMLEDGGHISVATGSRILVPFKKPLGDYLSKNPADTHCFRFSANALSNLLEKNGFKVKVLSRYIDGEFLVIIAQKTSKGDAYTLKKDNPKLVIDFFNRWHHETEWLKNNGLLQAA